MSEAKRRPKNANRRDCKYDDSKQASPRAESSRGCKDTTGNSSSVSFSQTLLHRQVGSSISSRIAKDFSILGRGRLRCTELRLLNSSKLIWLLATQNLEPATSYAYLQYQHIIIALTTYGITGRDLQVLFKATRSLFALPLVLIMSETAAKAIEGRDTASVKARPRRFCFQDVR